MGDSMKRAWIGRTAGLDAERTVEKSLSVLYSRRQGWSRKEKCPAGVFYRRRPVTDSPYRRDSANVRYRTEKSSGSRGFLRVPNEDLPLARNGGVAAVTAIPTGG